MIDTIRPQTLYTENLITNIELKTKDVSQVIQELQLKEWIESSLQLEPLSTVSLYQLYTNYSEYMSQVCKIVPFTKRNFSIALKKLLQQEIKTKKIEFFTRSSTFIRGIDLVEFEENGCQN